MQNLHLIFDYSTYSQKLGEDFAKFCGLLRIYELYKNILLIISDITVVLRSLTKLNYLLKTVLAKLSDWNQPNGPSMFSLIQVHLPTLQSTQVRHFLALVLRVVYF